MPHKGISFLFLAFSRRSPAKPQSDNRYHCSDHHECDHAFLVIPISSEGIKAPSSAYRLRSARSETGFAISAIRRLLILSRKVSSRSLLICFWTNLRAAPLTIGLMR